MPEPEQKAEVKVEVEEINEREADIGIKILQTVFTDVELVNTLLMDTLDIRPKARGVKQRTRKELQQERRVNAAKFMKLLREVIKDA